MNRVVLLLVLAALGGTAILTLRSIRVPGREVAKITRSTQPRGAVPAGQSGVSAVAERDLGDGPDAVWATTAGGGEGPAREAVAEGGAPTPCHFLGSPIFYSVGADGQLRKAVPMAPVGPDDIAVQVGFWPDGLLRPADDGFVLTGGGLHRRSTGAGDMYLFAGLGPGVYTVSLEDPRFAPWSVDGLEPGRCVQYTPQGSTMVSVRAVDGLRGRPLTDFLLERPRVRESAGVPYSIPWIPIPEVGRPGPDGARTWAVVPGMMDVRVAAVGYVSQELELEGLAIGEAHALEVRLMPTVRIAGRVVGEGGRPEAGARVQLVGPGERPRIFEPGAAYCGTGLPRALPETRTDADGVFAFAELAPGIWRVCAFTDVWRARMSEELELAPGEGREDLVLALASSGSLIGSLRIPPGALEGGALLVEPVSGPLVEIYRYPAQAIRLPVAADGGFASGPLPPGSARVSWRMPSFSYRSPGSSQPRAHPGGTIQIGTYDIAPGSPTEVVLDLSAFRPARLEIRLDPPRGPGRPAQVGLWSDPAAREPFAAAQAGPDGLSVFEAVLPGTYQLGVDLEGVPGRHLFPQPLGIEPGASLDLVRTLPVVRGMVRLVDDAIGAPLAHHPVGIRLGTDPQAGAAFETDGQGRLELELFPGIYILTPQPTSRRGSWRSIGLRWDADSTVPSDLRVEPVRR